MSINENIWELLSKILFSEATDEERNVFQELIKNDPQLQHQFELLQTLLNKQPPLEEARPSFDEVKAIIRKAEQPKAIKKHATAKYWIAAASVIAIVLTGAMLFTKSSNENAEVLKPIANVKKGKKHFDILPDGSKVWLNGDSKLYYVNDFNGNTREVRLEGEAFFDIVKNKKPFVVHVGGFDINVLGTAFNVKAYLDEDNVEATLYRGLINVSKHSDSKFQPIMLYPNQKLVLPLKYSGSDQTNLRTTEVGVRNETIKRSIIIKQIDSTKIEPQRIETAWVYNRLEFRGDDFEHLASKLERWFDVNIVFHDENAKRLTFNGSFENESITQALLALKTANSFNYKIDNNDIYISSIR